MVSSNDVARLFLQTMISRRIVSDKLARVLWRKCVEAVRGAGNLQYDLAQPDAKHLAADDVLDISYDPNKFEQYINELNRRLEPLDLKLTVTVDEVVGKKLWAMVRNILTLFRCRGFITFQDQHQRRRARSSSNRLLSR